MLTCSIFFAREAGENRTDWHLFEPTLLAFLDAALSPEPHPPIIQQFAFKAG